jgi:tetratricopeptide (TPR) repeat protein
MDESKQISTLESLTEVARTREQPQKNVRLANIRVSPGAYLATASVLTFSSALLLRSEKDMWALAFLAAAWLIVPVLAFYDRISFDGECLVRQGPIPFLFRLISGKRRQLRVVDFERVDTHAVRTLRRGGRVRYRYRTQITGKGTGFTFASGGRSYREMVRQLFPLIHDDKLDVRTRELRDYLYEPKSLDSEVDDLKLASAEVLDEASADFKFGRASGGGPCESEPDTTAHVERAIQLRQLANKLRVNGRLREAAEAFRRALIVIPRDGWLIYEFARLLKSQASAKSDARLLSRSRAALRLSELRAGGDAKLLSLIGESFLECGEVERAQRSFQRALELGAAKFRAHVGLADVALRTGKLAHVIHQYRDAARAASEKSLLLYARREADYYALLNEDDDYLVSELRRLSWLQHSMRIRRMAARVTNASILVALVGPTIESGIAGIGWALAASSLSAWIVSLFMNKLLSDRRKPRQVS